MTNPKVPVPAVVPGSTSGPLTPLPWTWEPGSEVKYARIPQIPYGYFVNDADAEFIVKAVNAHASLQAEVERLQQELDSVGGQLAHLMEVNACKALREAEAQVETLRAALEALSDRHTGWEHGFGPCICEPHLRARKLLTQAQGQEQP